MWESQIDIREETLKRDAKGENIQIKKTESCFLIGGRSRAGELSRDRTLAASDASR